MILSIAPDGTTRCLYTEEIDLGGAWCPTITCASHVVPDATGRWTADLWPVDGPQPGPFDTRKRGACRRGHLAGDAQTMTQSRFNFGTSGSAAYSPDRPRQRDRRGRPRKHRWIISRRIDTPEGAVKEYWSKEQPQNPEGEPIYEHWW